jgi:hypothetical protein
MSANYVDPETLSEPDRAEFWIRRIQQLDRVLEKPAVSLIQLVHEAIEKGPTDPDRRSFTTRTRITATEEEPFGRSLLIHAVACSAIQRLHQERRRFSWLGPLSNELHHLREWIPAKFTENPVLASDDILDVVRCLEDPVFGTLSPITSAEVFWLLIRAGEGSAHGTVGFLAMFSLLWALNRRMRPFEAGAALGRWRPTVAITARCLLPILKLNEILSERANIYRKLREITIDLRRHEQGRNQYDRWMCAATLDRLAATLHDLARVSIVPADFHNGATELSRLADPIEPRSVTAPIAAAARAILRQVLIELGDQNRGILAKAEYATTSIQPRIIDLLKAKSPEALSQWKLETNWPKQVEAALKAHDTCVRALAELQKAVSLSDTLRAERELTHDQLVTTLEALAQINDTVRNILRGAVEENIDWSVRGIGREVAYASSGNETDFDAVELLSAVEIAQWADKTSRAEVTDAIRQSFRVARSDGGWATGQPVFMEKRVLGVWPTTPDSMLLLASVVRPHERLHDADRHILKYVDWLEARLHRVRPRHWLQGELTGWQSETRESGISVWSTATSIKALLEIREIYEDRLWAICEDRFTVLHPGRGVHMLDPVDLGARHEQRLQRRLFRMTSDTLHHAASAEYAFVLHGPPGSSKTAVATAIGHDAWRVRRETRMPERPPRLVRITPADFTRRGEEALDFEARFIFRLLSHVRRVTIFFDEIDDLLRARAIGAEPTFIRLVIPGMLNRLQDLRDAAGAQELCFLLATNYIDQIEPALTRPGRIDGAVPVPYPDPWSRESILERLVKQKRVSDEVRDEIVSRTGEWPWTTYEKLCKRLVEDPTMEHARRLLDELQATLQSPDYYYRNESRWSSASPLVNELTHFVFGLSKDPQRCRARFGEILDAETIRRLGLMEHFAKEWKRERR